MSGAAERLEAILSKDFDDDEAALKALATAIALVNLEAEVELRRGGGMSFAVETKGRPSAGSKPGLPSHLIAPLKKVAEKVAKSTRANSFSVSVGFPFGVNVSLSWDVNK